MKEITLKAKLLTAQTSHIFKLAYRKVQANLLPVFENRIENESTGSGR